MLAIIGGTGLYQFGHLDAVDEHQIETPFGATSAAILEACYGKHTLFFLPRHGKSHEFLPHEVNYRANIYALKSLGVRRFLACRPSGPCAKPLRPASSLSPRNISTSSEAHAKRPS